MAGYIGMPAASLNIPSSENRVTGQSSTTVTAEQVLCHALHCPTPKHLGCCCGSSPCCYPGKKRGGFSASLLRKGKETAGRGRLFLAGLHLPAPELCLCLNSTSLQGACQFYADFHGHSLETLCWH